MKGTSIIIHTDGGARGNPGPAACAFVIEEGGHVLQKGSKFLGITTNNFAEYQGVILALNWLLENKGKINLPEAVFYLDSELIVRQLMGIYKVKDQKMKELNMAVNKMVEQLSLNIIFKNIPRERNKIADYLVNKELDKVV